MPSKRKGKRTAGSPARRGDARSGVDLNHVMLYSSDVPRALEFYRDLLGFEVIEAMEGYARIRAPAGNATIGLHTIHGPEAREMDTSREGIRLYFEVKELDRFCAELVAKGVKFESMPKDMPWGWRHAYLRDPDGHELSLYWAGKKRVEKSF